MSRSQLDEWVDTAESLYGRETLRAIDRTADRKRKAVLIRKCLNLTPELCDRIWLHIIHSKWRLKPFEGFTSRKVEDELDFFNMTECILLQKILQDGGCSTAVDAYAILGIHTDKRLNTAAEHLQQCGVIDIHMHNNFLYFILSYTILQGVQDGRI